MRKIGLYLAGGGARGSYQAGVLKAIAEILQCKKLPFHMISGVSVGSINAAILAEHADNFFIGVERLEALWREIHSQKVFNASNIALSKSFFRNLSHVFVKHERAGFLLDTLPLEDFIGTNINFDRIQENIEKNILNTMEVISNCYETQQTISFYQHYHNHFEDWILPRHASQSVKINREHLLSSSALPLFFPAVKINDYHYGDGSIGLVSPLRGTLRFNSEKILIIGTRHAPNFTNMDEYPALEIGFAQVLGNMLNGLFLDNLDRDIETVNRMNEIARLISLWKKRQSPWRPVETLYLRPSANLSDVAQSHYPSMPKLLRMMLNMMGAQSHSGDLVSFLLFEKAYTQQLIDIGYNDTMNYSKAIVQFVS